MSISDKLIQIRRIQQAIRAAIIGKGISVDGDFSTYPDAIELLKNPKGSMSITENGSYDVTEKVTAVVSVPVGASPVFGQVSGSAAKTLSIPAAVGKDNVAVFLISTRSSNLSVSTIIGAGYINGSMYMTYKNSSNIVRLSTTASWNKSTGVLSYTGSNSYNFSNNTELKYMYVAW